MPSDTPQQPKTFYVTTPIYYVNGRPHIGHAYTTIVADVLARRHRLLGDDTFFLTGTDEHGQKIERSAAAADIPPQQFADQVSAEFKQLWDRMGLTYDKFIRTTEPDHKRGVQTLFRTLYDRGFIYLSTYTGSYCVSDEAFVDQPAGTPCPDCGRPLETVTEENFFFKLSEFQKPLLDLIESNQLLITPDSARNEVLNFIRGDVMSRVPFRRGAHAGQIGDQEVESGTFARTEQGTPYLPGALKDLSISRSSFTWGVPVPDDIQQRAGATQPHVVYVWLDALANYITAIGYGGDSEAAQKEFSKWWPADLHLVGKEITRFHCVYWPAFLLAAGLPTPKQITANGWLLFDNAKMSKSKGNVVRTETILDAFGTLCPPVHLPAATTISTELDGEGENRKSTNGQHTNGQHTNGEDTSGRGTASAVPSEPPKEAASAAEVRPPTPHERDLFASDILRYFLLREIPFGQDGSFSFDAMVTRYNADLANGYGNLVSRTLNLLTKKLGGVLPERADEQFLRLTWQVGEGLIPNWKLGVYKGMGVSEEDWQGYLPLEARVQAAEAELRFNSGLENVWEAISALDGFLSANAPWKLSETDPEQVAELNRVLYVTAEGIRIITILLHPILPDTTLKVWKQLGLDEAELTTYNLQPTTQWGGLKPSTKLGPLSPIFPRADKSLAQVMIDMEDSRNTPATQTASTDPAAAPRSGAIDTPGAPLTVGGSSAEQPTLPTTPGPASGAPASGVFAGQQPAPAANPQDEAQPITIDDFLKIELRVAQILVAERIPKADKLLRLEVDLGSERRQILSGIAQWYAPEDLVGRRIVVVSNLAPRKMRGLESHGMLLAASEGPDGKPVLATFGEDIALGSRVR